MNVFNKNDISITIATFHCVIHDSETEDKSVE